MHFDLFYPVLDIIKAGAVVDSVGEDDAHSPSIVGLGDGLEAFLPGGVPDLKFDSGVAHIDDLGLEVDAWVGRGVPMVVRCELRKLFSVNLMSRLVLPTPLLPMMSSLIRQSYPCSRFI